MQENEAKAEKEKLYIDANSLLADSFKLARMVWDSGFRPGHIMAIWRGGAPVGVAVHEFLKVKGANMNHMAIKAQSYVKFEQTGRVEIVGLEHVVSGLKKGDKLLIVDDVFDTGLTMDAIVRAINDRCVDAAPDVRIATVYCKPLKNRTKMKPDFYVKEYNGWIVFPHELEGLTDEEIKKKGLGIYEIVRMK